MFTKPKIHYNNAFRSAQAGDDGTNYATCAEAVEVPADPFQVRGTIIPAVDVPNLDALKGMGIEFNTTGNKYTIVDNELLLDTLNAQYGSLGMNVIANAVIVGSYLYAVGTSTESYLMKVDLTTTSPTLVSQLRFDVTYENYPAGLCVNDDETIIYVACSMTPSVIVPVYVSDFTRGDRITLATGDNSVSALCWYDGNIFAVCQISPGRVVKISGSTHERLGYLDLSAGENLPKAICAFQTSLLVACYVTSAAPGIVVKIDPTLADPVRLGALTLNAGENGIRDILVIGASAYVCCYVSPAIVVKIDPSPATPTRTSARTLNAGENKGTCLGTDGTNLFCGTDVSPAIIVKLDPAAMTRTSALTLGAGKAIATSIRQYGSSLFVTTSSTSSYVVKMNPTAMTETSSWYDATVSEGLFKSAVIYGAYLFAACESSPSIIVKYDLATFTRQASLTLNAGENNVYSMAMYGRYIMAVCYTAPAIVVKIDSSSMTRAGSRTLNAGEEYATSAVMYGSNLIVGCFVSAVAGIVVKLDPAPANPTRLAALTFNAGENLVTGLAVYGTSVLAACRNIAGSPGKVVKFDPVAMTRTSVVTFNAGEELTECLLVKGTEAFAGLGTSPGQVVKFDPAAMTRTGVLALNAGENVAHRIVTDGDLLFVACNTQPGIIVRLDGDPANPTRLDAFTLASGEDYPNAMIYYSHSVVAALRTALGKVLQLNVHPKLTLYERLQDVDIEDGFTIRAGLSCAQAAATRPAFHIADNTRAPRFTGLVNTALYLRAHAPNFCQDGGFESGAFLPSWTAEAGWTVISSADKLEGAYSANWDLVATKYLMQTMTGKVKKNKTYTVLLKAKSVTANPTAGAITVYARQSGSNTDLDSDQTGYQPAITTTATWFSFDVIADFTTNDWYVKITGDHTKANGATAVVIDEVYIYEKKTINTLILGYHNLIGKAVTVNAWRLSPVRSTSAVDANNKAVIGNAITVDTADVFLASLTAVAYPVIELYIPATAGFTPEIGEAYLGDYWQLPNFLKGPLDPYRTNADGLIEQTWSVTNMTPTLRTTTVEDLFQKLRDSESVWCQWDTDPALLMESPRDAREAPYNPYRTDMSLRLLEKL